MFTGIVEELGSVVAIDVTPGSTDARLRVRGATVSSDVAHGDSIAVGGVCLTVVGFDGDEFTVDVMGETLDRTTVGQWRAGTAVNLERSVTPTTRLGGHVVQGHVDGVGTLIGRERHPAYDVLTFAVDAGIGKYIAEKGAIAIDGISLTVVGVQDTAGAAPGTEFTIGVIPETQRATTMGSVAIGSAVNIEVDVMAKYVERLLTAGEPANLPAAPAAPATAAAVTA
ncbi:riboflavin synthase [Nakamurella lactea]|uniref:riboflavin synthase n=1 Tax=Nakamurella lactea TaxID=459515 RepID=UPI00041EE0FE|nr:riboflavin synthase [Nakamurella lactea]